jgi:hypothetical protein
VTQVEDVVERERSMPLPANERVQAGQNSDERQRALRLGGRGGTVRKIEAVLFHGRGIMTVRSGRPEHRGRIGLKRVAELRAVWGRWCARLRLAWNAPVRSAA